VEALGKSIAAGQEAEETAKLLVKLYIKQDIHMPVLEYLIKQEVARNSSHQIISNSFKSRNSLYSFFLFPFLCSLEMVNTLFRGEELSQRVLRVYTRKRGKKYVNKVLYNLIKEVSDNNYNYEVQKQTLPPPVSFN